MGVTFSSLPELLASQRKNSRYQESKGSCGRDSFRCLPVVPFQPLRGDVYTPTQDGLFLSFKALPKSFERAPAADDTLWWTDAQFLPYSDSQVVVMSSPYQYRPGRPLLACSKIPAGRILLYNFNKHPLGCVHFKGTSSTVLPRILPHPLGQFIMYAESSAGIKVINMDNVQVYRQPDNMNVDSCKCCALAPNGIDVATIHRSQGFFKIHFFRFDNKGTMTLKCHQLCPGFVGHRSYADRVDLKWSPDSRLLAVGLFGAGVERLFVVDKNSDKNSYTLSPDLLEYDISSERSFDFDPKKIDNLAVATSNNFIHITDVVNKEVLSSFEDTNASPINCIQYNNQGTKLAVAHGDFEIRIYDSESFELLQEIDMKCDERLKNYVPCDNSLAVLRLGFNFSGTLLAASVCDGFVRVWVVPHLPTLQDFCKLKILSLIPVMKVVKLALPEKIKDFLLSV